MLSGIYEIRNLIDNKIYIGSARNLNKRKNQHLRSLETKRHHNILLQRAYNKYGKENFVFKILLYCDIDNLLLYEQICIDKFKPEYNICLIAGNTIGCTRSDETRRRLSESHMGFKVSEETKLKISESEKGRKLTKDSIIKRTNSRAEFKQSDAAKLKIGQSKIGNKNMLGHKHSEETKIKIGLMSKGRHHSEETKLKMSLSHKKRQELKD